MRYPLAATAKHANLIIFLILFIVHASSVTYVSNNKYIDYTFLYGLCVIATYFLGQRIATKHARLLLISARDRLSHIPAEPLLTAVDIFVIVFPIGYFAFAGWVPVWKMIYGTDYYANSGLRHEFYGQLPATLRYAGEYMLRGVAPFWLLYSYMTGRRLFPLVFASCALFALCLVTKAYIVIVMLPILIYQVIKLRFKSAIITTLAVATVLFANVVLPEKSLVAPVKASSASLSSASPSIEATPSEEATPSDYLRGWHQGTAEVLDALIHRVFYGNGLTVTQWMDTYTLELPLEKGCGYRWIAPLISCDFISLPHKIWLKYYPELEAKGLSGTVSVANYIYAYANFGAFGIVASGIAMGLLIVFLSVAITSATASIALNTSFLALSFETPLSILLNSGGWGIVILLAAFFLHGPTRIEQRTSTVATDGSNLPPNFSTTAAPD